MLEKRRRLKRELKSGSEWQGGEARRIGRRAKLPVSRGFPIGLALQRHPSQFPIRLFHAALPGVSPYMLRISGLTMPWLAHRNPCESLIGVTSQASATRAPLAQADFSTG